MFDLLFQRYQAEIEHDELLAGILASTVANYSLAAPETRLVPSLFMPSEWRKKAMKAKDPQAAKRKVIGLNIGLFLRQQMETQSQGK